MIFGMLYQFMPGERALHRQLMDQMKAIHSNHLETNERRNHDTVHQYIASESRDYPLHHGELI